MNLSDYKKQFLLKYDRYFFFDGTSTTLTNYYCREVMPTISFERNRIEGSINRYEGFRVNGFFTGELERNGCGVFAPPEMEVGANIFLRRYAVYLLKEDDILFGKKNTKSLIPVIYKKGKGTIKDNIIESISALGFSTNESYEFLSDYADSIVIIVQQNNGMTLDQITQVPKTFDGLKLKILAISDERFGDVLGYRWSLSRFVDEYTVLSNYCSWLADHLLDSYFSSNKTAKANIINLKRGFHSELFIPNACCFSFAISYLSQMVSNKPINIYEDTKNFIEQKILSFSKKESSKLNVHPSVIQEDVECYMANYVLSNIFRKQSGKSIKIDESVIPNNGKISIPHSNNSFIFENGVLNSKKLRLLMNDYFSYFGQFEIYSYNFFSKGPELHFIYWIYYASMFIDVRESASFIDYLNNLGSNGLFIPIMSVLLIEKCFATLPNHEAKKQADKIINSFLMAKREQFELNKNKTIAFGEEELSYDEAYHRLLRSIVDFRSNSYNSVNYPYYFDYMDSTLRSEIEYDLSEDTRLWNEFWESLSPDLKDLLNSLHEEPKKQ